MPDNKSLTFEVDILPDTTATYNLGNASKQWKLNGKTPGDAIEKDVDSSIADASTSSNLPTSAAVASFVENKGYTTLNARVEGTTLIIE